jgi:hypothetical protein
VNITFSRRSQAATEYLIILAIVIVIALTVVGTLGGIPGIGGGAGSNVDRAQLASLTVGILNYKQDSHSTLLEFRNNNPSSIQINSMWINGKKCTLYPSNSQLFAGQSKQITCYGVVGLDEGSHFEYDFNITYTDVKAQAQYVITPDVDLVGTIVAGSELHTGQKLCYVGDTSASATCNSTYYGEDGYVDGISKSFTTKSGNVVKDDHTGLYWTGNVSTGKTQPQAVTYCDDLVQGGYSDWRLPNIVELVTVMDSGNTQQGLHSDWVTGNYWSSTQDPVTTANYWIVEIISEFFSTSDQAGTTTDSVVCVRGTTNGITLTDGRTTRKSFVDLGDGVVIDEHTGLVWDKLGTSGTYTWTAARTYCDDLSLAGYDDWRLPMISEAIVMMDFYCSGAGAPDSACNGDYSNSALDASAEDRYYWTGTTSPSSAGDAYLVDMDDGFIAAGVKGEPFSVRCVRDR